MKGTEPAVVSAGIIVVDHVASVERIPSAGELLLTERCGLHMGGCASNVALGLGRLGISSRVLGSVGDDAFGHFARRQLSERGIETDFVEVSAGIPTSQTLVINVVGEDRRFIHLPGANDHFDAAWIAETLTPGVRVLYVGGLFLMAGLDAAALGRVFQEARKRKVLTVLDVVTPDRRDYLAALKVVLPHTDYFLPNEDEARIMTGSADPFAQARLFCELGAKTTVITRGQAGSVYARGAEVLEVSAYPAAFVDGTGGGDAFTAGFISGLVHGADARETLRRASALGASCVQAVGATEGVFTSEELDRFLAANDLPMRRLG